MASTSLRGGARVGAGRKRKATIEKYENDNPGHRKLEVIDVPNNFEGGKDIISIYDLNQNCEALVSDTCQLENDLAKQKKEVDLIREHVDLLIKANSTETQNQDEYLIKFNELQIRYNEEIDKYNSISNRIQAKKDKGKQIDAFMKKLKFYQNPIEEWNLGFWNKMVETALVHVDGTITFRFYGGQEVTV